MRTRRLYASPSLPDRTFVAGELRELAGRSNLNITQTVQRGTPIAGYVFADVGEAPKVKRGPKAKPKAEGTLTEFGRAPKVVVCRCDICRGKVWALTEIRALPGVPISVNAMTLPKISRVTGHLFGYQATVPKGDWHPAAAPAPRPAGAAPARLFNDGMPINPRRLDSWFVAGAEGGGT